MNLIGNWKFLAFNGIISLIFGLLLVVNPTKSFDVALMSIGILIVIASAFMLISEALINKTKDVYSLIQFFLFLIIGIFLTVKPEAFIDLIFIGLGAYALIYGGINLYNSFKLKPRSERKRPLLISGATYFLLGIILILANNLVEALITSILGVILLMIGSFVLYFANEMRKDEAEF